MSQIEFLFNGCRTLIQCQYSDKFEEVLEKLRFKIGINLDSVYYLYSGKVLKSKNVTINEIINHIDRENNKMIIQIIDKENNQENSNIIIKSADVICPKCQHIAKISINDYRIRIYDCIHNHNNDNISLEEYENTQKVNLSKIICDECKIKNKGNS